MYFFFFPGGGVPKDGYMALGSFLFLQEQIKDIIISKVGLAAAKAAALRINLNVHGCIIVAPTRSLAGISTAVQRLLN